MPHTSSCKRHTKKGGEGSCRVHLARNKEKHTKKRAVTTAPLRCYSPPTRCYWERFTNSIAGDKAKTMCLHLHMQKVQQDTHNEACKWAAAIASSNEKPQMMTKEVPKLWSKLPARIPQFGIHQWIKESYDDVNHWRSLRRFRL